MLYKKSGDKIIARLDKGEEIIEKLKFICEKENIQTAEVSALGAINNFMAGIFKPVEKQYISKNFKGNFEIVSLTGTITSMNNEPYAHLHISAANEDCEVFGGHLNSAYISATCEMVINVIPGKTERYYDQTIGLNLLEL